MFALDCHDGHCSLRDVTKRMYPMKMPSVAASAVALAVLGMLSLSTSVFPESKGTGLYLQFVQVVANDRHRAGLSPQLLSTAVVDGQLTYVVATDSPGPFRRDVLPEYIVGLLRNPSKGIVKGNLVKGLPFLQRVWQVAADYMDEGLRRSIMESQMKASILIDGRAPDPMARYSVLKPDVIGIYWFKNGKIVFEPNEEYELVNENGPIQLTPFIVKAFFAK